MHLSSKPPFDHVAVMSEFPDALPKDDFEGLHHQRVLGCFFPLCHHPRLSVVVELPLGHPLSFVPTMAPSHLGGFLDSFGDPSLWHTESHPLLTPCSGQLPQVHLPSQAAPPFLFSFLPPPMMLLKWATWSLTTAEGSILE